MDGMGKTEKKVKTGMEEKTEMTVKMERRRMTKRQQVLHFQYGLNPHERMGRWLEWPDRDGQKAGEGGSRMEGFNQE